MGKMIDSANWALRGYQIRADDGKGQHIGTYVTNRRDGAVMAKAPRMLDVLDDIRGYLRRNKERCRTATKASVVPNTPFTDWTPAEKLYHEKCCAAEHEAARMCGVVEDCVEKLLAEVRAEARDPTSTV